MSLTRRGLLAGAVALCMGLFGRVTAQGNGKKKGHKMPAVLLDGLVGWSFAAGPAQTLASTGVVASGALDLTNNGSVTFDANGALFDGISQWLSHANAAALQTGGASFLFAIEFKSLGNPVSGVLVARNALDNASDEFSIKAGGAAGAAGEGSVSATCYDASDSGYGVDQQEQDFPAGHSLLLVWLDKANATLNLQLNNGAVTQATEIPADVTTSTDAPFGIGAYNDNLQAYYNGYIRNVRYWKGANAATIGASSTYRTWLYNAGAGRTDAEVAAYTGGGGGSAVQSYFRSFRR